MLSQADKHDVDYTPLESSRLVAKLGSAHTVNVETYSFPCDRPRPPRFVCVTILYLGSSAAFPTLFGSLCVTGFQYIIDQALESRETIANY